MKPGLCQRPSLVCDQMWRSPSTVSSFSFCRTAQASSETSVSMSEGFGSGVHALGFRDFRTLATRSGTAPTTSWECSTIDEEGSLP